MELEALKKWYEDLYKKAEWFKNTDLQWALNRKERSKQEFEQAVQTADDMLKLYAVISDRRDLILEVIRDRDPDFEGILDKKEGE